MAREVVSVRVELQSERTAHVTESVQFKPCVQQQPRLTLDDKPARRDTSNALANEYR